MILYPAIDLKDGQCVRLLQGDMDKATIFNNSPAEQALAFQNAGCEWLHLVDLNGAFAGQPVNEEAVVDILDTCKIPIQLGGGIRHMGTLAYWIDTGITRIILGTAAAEDPNFVREAAKEFPDQIAVGIDARDGLVATNGWAKDSKIKALDLAKKYEDSGVAAIIYTDISRDGLMQGPNIMMTAHIANNVSIPVIASGGVSNLEDLKALRDWDMPLNGAIVGRAIYDKQLSISSALLELSTPLGN